jgi:uncharacterized membrane protein (DUF485 family)
MASNNDTKVYQDKKAKAEDFKSSAYTLLFVGIIGIIALILINMGLLPIKFVGTGKYLTNIVMGVLFVIFIVIGISSFKSSKEYEKEAVDEEDLTQQIMAWVKDNITQESIKDEVYFEQDTPEEMKYFKYSEAIKSRISEKFDNLNAAYLDALCDELYADIFEEVSEEND